MAKKIIKSASNKKTRKNSNNSINSGYAEASLRVSNTLENFRSQLELVRKEKYDFYLKHKCSELKSKEKIIWSLS